MPDRLQEIRARLDAATPGPWYADNNTERLWVCQRGTGRPIADVADSDQSRNLIAHAPADIAWLLDRVRDLEAGIVTACQIGVRDTTGQEAQALASLMHDLNVPGVDDA